jgi:fatty acid desaturase
MAKKRVNIDKSETISPAKKELIDLNLLWIKEEHNFIKKTFFSLLCIVLGAIFLFFKSDLLFNEIEMNYFVIFIVLSVLIFWYQITFTLLSIKKSYRDITNKIITSQPLKKYEISKTDFVTKLTNVLPIGLLVWFAALIVSSSLFLSVIIAVGAIFLILYTPKWF